MWHATDAFGLMAYFPAKQAGCTFAKITAPLDCTFGALQDTPGKEHGSSGLKYLSTKTARDWRQYDINGECMWSAGLPKLRKFKITTVPNDDKASSDISFKISD